MKKLLFLICIFCALKANAQNYLISFAGAGSSAVSTVKVENLTKGTSLTINGSDILRLTTATAINPILDKQSSELKIYPNPMTENSILEIYPPVEGDAVITVLDMTGKPLAQILSHLENFRQDFRLSGIKNGIYLINVKGNNYRFSGTLLSNGKSNGTIKIERVNSVIQAVDEKEVKADSKGTQATVDMDYSTGDRLKFTGISGNYSTVKTDIPTSDKTITFNFIGCTDGDNNNYPVVVIGTQTWMAENLKTTKYSDNTNIPLVTDNTAWHALYSPAYCWYNNDEAANKGIYGAMYNWFAVNKLYNGQKNVCPTGWKVPYESEWTILTEYLTNNGYGYEGSGNDIAKSLAASKGWTITSTEIPGSVSNELSANNSTGFTALPSGTRSDLGEFSGISYFGSWWSLPGPYINGPFDMSYYPYMVYWDKILAKEFTSRWLGQPVRCLLGQSITTAGVSNITQTTAVSGGNIVFDAGEMITERGVCWSISPNPTINNNKTTDGAGTGSFTSSITGLTANNTYYVRAYATNILGTNYGDELIFKTYSGTVTDIEGNVYYTVTIGTQNWIAENLKTTKLNDGTAIPLVIDITSGEGLTTPGYGWYNNDESAYKDIYGAIYNWYAIKTEKLCPATWHVPTDGEWTILTDYLRNNSGRYGIAKAMASISGWKDNHLESGNSIPGNYQAGNNSSGFNGIPIGLEGRSASWGSSLERDSSSFWERLLMYNDYDVFRVYGGTSYVRCLQGELPALPVLTTTPVNSITQTTAISGGNITNTVGTTVTSRGICWNKRPNPTIDDNKTTDGTGTGSFTSSITGLTPGTTYYARAYVTTIFVGTTYGNEIKFLTIVSDIDGNVYNTVNIGTQVWMAENLKTTRYRNGDLIGTTTPSSKDIISESTPEYQWAYGGDEDNVAAYGRLYTWDALNDSRYICPTGWHVPAHAEWTTLTDYLGGLSESGGKLKEAGLVHWISPNTGATNETGFTALPGGYRFSNGGFGGLGSDGLWWSSTGSSINESWTIGMGNSYTGAYEGNNSKRSGYSVRCLQGESQKLLYISTTGASNVTPTTAISSGIISGADGASVTSRGLCWSTSANPTIDNNMIINGSGAGTFTSSITGLTANTTYYVRAYATNGVGTNYGNQVSFTTPATSIILTTSLVTNITGTTATGGGNITSDGGISTLSRGVCWSTSLNPTIEDNKTNDGTGTGIFISSITGLTANTTYHVRAYATNNEGTAYGTEVIIKTYSGTVTDIDENVYKTITIGTQTWLADNLKTTKYNDGTAIPPIANPTSWAILSTPGYCWYNNDPANFKATYGALYNSYSVYSSSNGGKNVCPAGWHVPSDSQWTILTDYLTNNGYGDGGSGNDIAKSMLSISGWYSSELASNNSSGFTAFPAGYRSSNGSFGGSTNSTYWIALENQYYSLTYYDSTVNKGAVDSRRGYSVRCLKDN